MNIFNFNNIYKLPYNYNFLIPAINEQQLKQHYEGHLIKYYQKLTFLLKEHQLESKADNLIELVKYTFGKQNLLDIFNNAGQIVNHIHFFENFVNKEINPNTLINIRKNFNKDNIIEEALNISGKFGFGSSWLWIASNKNTNIKMFVTPNSFIPENLDFIDEILLCIDLWEHAYYLQYMHNRNEYIKQIIPKTNIYKFLK
ncbi:superoxide dismutase [uncultured bacterium]|nr:superoxide dismutase [uncultured bacterium]